MKKNISPWSLAVAVEDIPENGLHVAIEPTAATLAALAKFAHVRDLSRLSAAFDLTRRGAKVHVVGQVSGAVGQNCVVSLQPMQSDVEERIDLTFASVMPAGEVSENAAEGHRTMADPEPPEPLIGGQIDLGAIATEFLILGIDPYPRKPGAQFTPPPTEDPGTHPFAALDALKKRPGGGPS